jgi:hypothetical protein
MSNTLNLIKDLTLKTCKKVYIWLISLYSYWLIKIFSGSGPPSQLIQVETLREGKCEIKKTIQ